MGPRLALALAVVTCLSARLAAGPSPSPGDRFASAIERADLAAVKELVEGGASPDTPIEYGPRSVTPLIKAAWEGRTDIARYLLGKGADVDARSSDSGETALQQAATRGYDDLVELLLRSGADRKAQDERGNTPFTAALFNGHLDVAEMLHAAGAADVNAAGAYGITPLMTASSVCNPEVLRFLVEKGAAVDKVSQLEYGGTTALTTAARTGQADCVRTLLELGANPHLKMKSGATALSNARESGNEEVVDLLATALAKPAPKPRKPPARKP